MSNLFGSINQAMTGINAASYQLSIVSQNITNAETDGYSREVANQGSVDGAYGVSTVFSGRTSVGGTTVLSTTRADDPVVDAQVRSAHANSAAADTTASQLSSIESIFPEPSDSGLSTQLSKLWADFATVANDPSGDTGGIGARTVLIGQAGTVAGQLNSMSASLTSESNTVSGELNNDINNVNTAASQLATLNGQLAVASATGSNANSLLDQRDTLLNTISKATGAAITINANGSATVAIGGQNLVNGTTASSMSVDSSYQVSVGGTAVSVPNGSMSAEVTALTSTIPGYQSKLDSVANALITKVNSLQSSGYDLNGNSGAAMFSGTGAADIAVSLTDPKGIAASSASGTLDGANALAAASYGTLSDGPDSAYVGLVGDVAQASANAQQQSTIQDSVTSNVDAVKASISGVNYDEEVSNMLTYQHAFSASSRVLTTLDSMLDTLINHTGLVGLG